MKDFEPIFNTMGTPNQVICSADPLKCPVRKAKKVGFINVFVCTHENAPLPREDLKIVYRVCRTPETDESHNS